jgi:ParB-like chromosome segregation protein Spo0J
MLNSLRQALQTAENPEALIAEIRQLLHEYSPQKTQPVDLVRWVPIDKVCANDYNPNRVAQVEMRLLYTSIRHDGYTQPVVTVYDKTQDRYIIVDGFHRYYVMKTHKDIYDSCHGLLPVVVIDKPINDRMASTVRHSRARGKHSVQGMSNLVFHMLENGWKDEDICNELGMGPEELLRLKHITGFSKLFQDLEYQKSWVTERQVRIRKEYEARKSHG